MAVTPEDIAFVTDLFAGLAPLKTRKMMGGLSIYSNGQIFAILDSRGGIYLKAKDDFAKRLEAAGSSKFVFDTKDGKTATMHYWSLPETALDDPAQATQWGQAALTAAYG